MNQMAIVAKNASKTMSSIELVEVINDLDEVCKFAMTEGASAEDISLACDAFDSITNGMSVPRPRSIVLLDLSLILLLDEATRRESVQIKIPGIYVIEYSNKTVKIGRTSFFNARLRQLSMQGGISAERSAFFPCSDMCKAESLAHSEFKGHRLSGEFFCLQFEPVSLRLASIAMECNQ